VGRYPKAFRKMAVERLKSCDNIVALSQELGVHRRMLYKWRDQLPKSANWKAANCRVDCAEKRYT
jgi:transposase-like protein